jgi:adenylate kinase
VCDACESALVQRPDDTPDVIRDRLRVYAERTLPIAERYRSLGVLKEIDGGGSADVVAEQLKACLVQR